jgi:tol-pal system protein YbgF
MSLRFMGAMFLGIFSAGCFSLEWAGIAQAQGGPADLAYRIERLENQIRQLTGDIEQLQYRNQQLEAALNEMRYQDSGGRSGPRVAAAPPPAVQPMPQGTPVITGGAGGRRGDTFNPSDNPNAPGVPRALGSVPPQPPPPNTRPGMERTPYAPVAANSADQGYGRPAGPGADGGYVRPAGPGGDYGRPAAPGADAGPGYGRPPAGAPGEGAPPPAATVATAAPPPAGAGSPKEVYDAGIGFLQHRDYVSAEQAFRDFLTHYPADRMAGEAQFNLGESLFQRQSYQEAADAFVQMSKKYENSGKAPDALLRLGQSLAALNEKELACVAFADVGRKYPRARSDVKQAVERELKRARC